MSGETLAVPARPLWMPLGWLPAVALLAVTAAVGPSLGATARPLFILGCGAAGWYAWTRGPVAHVQTMLVLFSFAALVRRLVDLSAGYDPSGLMLVGPLLAILAPLADAKAILQPRDVRHPQTMPIVMIGGCVVYATALSLFQGDWMNAASGSIKWFAPLLYAAVLARSSDSMEAILRGATTVFLFILPIMGLYGIIQYVDPPEWDRYWMKFASIMSAGQPVPYGVRTFSTMNGPASFATYTATGLVLVCFLRSGWQSLLLAAPAALSLLLSAYRTAWISLALSVLFCLLFQATRRRAAGVLLGLVVAVAAAGTLTPFGDVIGDRLATFSQGSQDGSARERVEEFTSLWQLPDSGLVGIGFTTIDVGVAGSVAVDGMLVSCWLTMGLVAGLICLAGVIWAAVNPILAAFRGLRADHIVVGALAVGALEQIPLANITSGELGVLFWTFAVLIPASPVAAAESVWED